MDVATFDCLDKGVSVHAVWLVGYRVVYKSGDDIHLYFWMENVVFVLFWLMLHLASLSLIRIDCVWVCKPASAYI